MGSTATLTPSPKKSYHRKQHVYAIIASPVGARHSGGCTTQWWVHDTVSSIEGNSNTPYRA